MTAHTRFRRSLVGAAVVALVAPLLAVVAMASSASAAVGPRPHEVYMYKVEKHVDLSGEYPDNYSGDVYLSCNDGDYALDGMWKVSHVDQPSNEPVFDSTAIYNDERDVVFYTAASYDKSTYLFRFENYADGNAQIKLFLTCIRKQTEATANHKHDIVVTGLYYKGIHAGFGNSSGSFDDYDDSWVGGHSDEWGNFQECPSGYYAVAPSYDFYDSYDYGTKNWLYRSYVSDNGRSWNWAFLLRDVSSNIHLNVGYRCLRGYVGNTNFGGNHSHQLPIAFKPGYNNDFRHGNPYWANYLNFGSQEKQFSCDDGYNGSKYQDYKAMVGGWYIWNPFHTWYWGMDPRPKTRAYQFYYDGYGFGSNRVDLGIMCVKSRTGKQTKPVFF